MEQKNIMKMPDMGGETVVFKGKHWSDIRFVDNILEDALMKHVFGIIQFGMADFGEVMEILLHITPNDEECWIKEWGSMAERLQERAKKSEKNGHKISASSAYLRAGTYWRVALMYFSDFKDSRMAEYTKSSEYCYEKYLELSDYPGKAIKIPYENVHLKGHFYRSTAADEKAPLLIITPGRDTWGEDTRWVYDNALKRGIHCLVYEGPGQGSALRLDNMPFRYDWENVITPVIDYALTFDGIDKDRIAIMGLSFGGFLSPRAAAFDKRIKLCIADPGSMNWGAGISERLNMVKDFEISNLPPAVRSLVTDYAWKHGVETSVQAVVDELKKYDNADIIDKITCTMLVLDGTAEVTPGVADKFYDALKCPKHYLLFDETTTAQTHTQMGGYGTAAEILFDKIEELL